MDAVLCTHAHTDHMDPATLQPLLSANPGANLVVPRAVLGQSALRAGRAEAEITPVDAGESVEILPGITLTATRAAHETLEEDEAGRHRFLGYACRPVPSASGIPATAFPSTGWWRRCGRWRRISCCCRSTDVGRNFPTMVCPAISR